jgi:hypothetical protein
MLPDNAPESRVTALGVEEPLARLPRRRWWLVRPGEQAPALETGDLIFRAGNQHVISVAVCCGQFLHQATRPYARWNHVMVVEDAEKRTAVHATGQGLRRGSLDVLDGKTFAVVRFECSEPARAYIRAFAEYSLVGRPRWGYLTAASQLFTMLTGCRLVFGALGTVTCSGFAASAMVRTGATFERPAPLMSPADLARECGLPGAIRADDVAATARRVTARLRPSNGTGPP